MRPPQIFELCQVNKGFISNINVMIVSCIFLMSHERVISFQLQ